MGHKSKPYFLAILMFVSVFALSQEKVKVTWNASTDNVGVAGYNVWIDAEYEGTTQDTFYTFNLEPGTYMIAASAFDAAGNESDLSIPLLVDVFDRTEPTVPYDLMEVFPNPSLGAFNVQFNTDLFAATLQIYTPTGKLVYERDLPDSAPGHVESLDLTEFPNQPYVVVLQRDEERIGKTHLMIS